jgi:hypothetical protein
MHQKLFDTMPAGKIKGLTIAKADKQKLSKNQEAFNKLTQKIERLQKEIEKKQLQMDLAMKLYGTDVQTCRFMLTEQRRELIIVLWDNYNAKKLSKPDQRCLKQIIREHVQFLFMELGPVQPDTAIKKIFEALEGDNYDEMLEQERESARKEMVEELKKFKVNLKKVDTGNEEELAKLLHETRQKLFEEYTADKDEFEQTQKVKKKSAKQLEAEKLQQEMDEIKQKNIGTIYKQLAKLFHPDLEQDEERKLEKEILMKELTVAYEAKNLHALLTLELRWIHKENEHLESLTEEKLAVYLQILKEQAQDLEYEKNELYHHPQYAVLLQQFGWDIRRAPVQTVQKHLVKIYERVKNFKININDFKSDLALRYIKQMIKQWKEDQEDDNITEEELYKMLYGK